ncbi:MAG: hypothetical protein WC943_14045 [Elusimicrobiota bacterium]|jgi:hypothetical protein
MTTETETTTKAAFETATDEVLEETTERDPSKVTQRTPPKKGICRRCGEDKPVNRMMLCYPCWVKTRLEERGWREGMPHPDDCGCVGLGAHPELKSDGN